MIHEANGRIHELIEQRNEALKRSATLGGEKYLMAVRLREALDQASAVMGELEKRGSRLSTLEAEILRLKTAKPSPAVQDTAGDESAL